MDDGGLDRLAGFLCERAGGTTVRLAEVEKLAGGAIQENWGLVAIFDDGPLAGPHALVLRTDAPSRVAASHDRIREFQLLRAAFRAGVTVPEPLWLCDDAAILGRPFYVMRRADGVAVGPRVVRDTSLGGDRDALIRRLAAELARIHAIRPDSDLAFLGPPPADPAAAAVALYRGWLDALDAANPVLEWTLAWLARQAPAEQDVAFCHRDFRTGNYMVDGAGLTAILDWEFAGWSDPHEDLAWFCTKYWRFGGTALEAGGIAHRRALVAAYESATERAVEPRRLDYWEIMSNVRWCLVALQQGERHLSGEEPSLELALVGRRPPEMEWEMLRLIERYERMWLR